MYLIRNLNSYNMRIYVFIAFTMYITSTEVTSQEDCPAGWQTSRTDKTWPCYLLTNKIKRTWQESQIFCTQMGGSLLKIESHAEMLWVYKILKVYQGYFPTHKEWWIGMHDNPAQTGLLWIDRKPVQTSAFQWSPGEPTSYHHNKACIEYYNGTLRHQDCSTAQYFACKRQRDTVIWCDSRHNWESINNKCYKAMPKLLTYDDARQTCQQENGDLFVVNGGSDEQVLWNFVESRKANMWIGLRYYNDSNGVYSAHWNGQTGKTVTAKASYWSIRHPDQVVSSSSGQTSCVYADPSLTQPNIWNLGNCSQTQYSLCQKSQGSCASGWIRVGQTCYALNTGPKLTWDDANSYCKQRGAELIHISDQATQDFVNRNLQALHARGLGSIWIGLSDGTTGNRWLWANGVIFGNNGNNYNNFAVKNPADRPGIRDCFNIFTDDRNGTWQVATNCSSKKSFMCNIAINKVPIVPTAPPPTGSTTPSLATTPHTPIPWTTDCGPFWVKDKTTGYCYYITDHEVTWLEAQNNCQSNGANLASINTNHDERFIADRLFGFKSAALWIGMNNLNGQEGYEWTDGSGFGYMNWAPGEPNNYRSNEHCAEFIAFQEKLGQWNDVNCNDRRGYICKKKSTDFPTAPTPTNPIIPGGMMYGCPNAAWQSYGDNCYKFMTQPRSWENAAHYCEGHKSNLSSISNENEQNFVFSQLPAVTGYRDQFWIGLNDQTIQMSFKWTDNSTVTFTSWARGEPNNYQNQVEDCVTILQKTGNWNDEVCESQQAGFICKTQKQLLPKGSPQHDYGQGCSVYGSMAYGYKCFHKVTSITSFDKAQKICTNNGGHLAVIKNRYQQAFLASQITSHTGVFGYFYIGLKHDSTNGKLMWVNNDPLDFTAWSANHTGNDNTSCVAMKTSAPGVGLWVDKPCQTSSHFICEYPRTGFSTRFISTTTPPAPPTCPPKWSEYDGYCYKAYVGSDSRTWLDARDYCQGIGANLVSLHSSAEQTFASRTISGGYYSRTTYWIGFNDFDREKAYKWSDGSAVSYTNWGQGEPNDVSGTDDCVELNKNTRKWNDNNCYIVKAFICKIIKGKPLSNPLPFVYPTPASICSMYPGWKQFGHFCYYISSKYGVTSRLSWYDAQKYCLKNGGHLASVHSEQENNFFVTLISMTIKNDVWIGLSDLNSRHFEWTDGTALDYTKWSGNEPNDAFGSEHCGQINNYNGFWNDNDCNELYHFVCKKPLQRGTSGSPPTTTVANNAGCPQGFTQQPNDNKCYKFRGNTLQTDPALNYSSARDSCRRMGNNYDIASISDYHELAYIMIIVNYIDSIKYYDGIWIGFNDQNNNRRFTWQDSSEVKYTNWAKGQPPWSLKCTKLLTDDRNAGQWNAIDCGSKLPYLCQTFRDPQYTPQTWPNPPLLQGQCSPGWVENYPDCFKVHPNKTTWQDAQKSCKNDGGSMASIRNLYEQYFIDSITWSLKTPVWIGLGDPQMTGTFVWDDNYPTTFINWGKGEPTYTQGESCVSTYNGYWNDTMCGNTYPFVCVKHIFPMPPASTPLTGFCADTSWKPFENHCYRLVLGSRMAKTYDDAERDCMLHGMNLTSITSKNEEIFLLRLIDTDPNPNDNVWIGFRKRGGFYSWADNAQRRYINWQSTGPTGRECVYMKHADGKWGDASCTKRMGYLCKTGKHPQTMPPPTTTPMTTTTTPSTTSSSSRSPSTSTSTKQSVNPYSNSSPSSTNSYIYSSSTQTPVSSSTPNSNIPLPQSSKQINIIHNDLSAGAIVGVIAGTLALLLLIIVALMVLKKRSPGLFSFKTLHNEHGFDNAAYDRNMDSVNINGTNGRNNGRASENEKNVGFVDFEQSDA